MPNPVIEAYKRHIDRTLIRENLKLSPESMTSCKSTELATPLKL